MPKITDIIDEKEINRILKKTSTPTNTKVDQIINKALKRKGLSLEEVGHLINTKDPKLIKRIHLAAHKIKQEIYGERLVFFAPLYISNYCVNDCEYCGFHARNSMKRKRLTLKEVEQQAKILIDMGHKRLLLEFGEHALKSPIDYVVDVIKTIYRTKSKNGEIRRVNINIAATTTEDYKKLKEVGIGTYQLFQETYHRETYEKMHKGPKADYSRQLFAHDHAFEAGVDDVGLGVLFGLYNYKFEVLALVSHAQYLDEKYNVGPHTFSVPRFQPAPTVDLNLPHKVSEEEILNIIAVLRLSVPYTGMIISTRETPALRAKAFHLGISQTSSASRTSPGGYGKSKELKQFSVSDERPLDETIKDLLKSEHLPSFCTACYRKGRTGETFMHLAKPGEIHHLCRPNAILTFKEYLEDYATEDIKESGEKIIDKYLQKIASRTRRHETIKRLKKIEQGARDLYF